MVAIRLWIDDKRIISTRKRPLLSEAEIVKSFEENRGPVNTGEFIIDLSYRLISRMEATIQKAKIEWMSWRRS
jgi:zinc transporter